ncbi:MAG: TIGR01244 family sulfur transferase [Vibrio sp.]
MTINIVPLTHDLSVTGQISQADLAFIADAGFKTIIANRPDGEGDNQPLNIELAKQAQQLGLTFIEQPVISTAITDDNYAEFASSLKTATKPILAFCRTGTRCSRLWVEASDDLGNRDARRDKAIALGFTIPA